jgi:ribosomal protein S27E
MADNRRVNPKELARFAASMESLLDRQSSEGAAAEPVAPDLKAQESAMQASRDALKRRRFFWAKCRDCGHKGQVRRKEVLHAAAPRCTRCGGMLDLNTRALAELDHYVHGIPPQKSAEE